LFYQPEERAMSTDDTKGAARHKKHSKHAGRGSRPPRPAQGNRRERIEGQAANCLSGLPSGDGDHLISYRLIKENAEDSPGDG